MFSFNKMLMNDQVKQPWNNFSSFDVDIDADADNNGDVNV